MILFICYQHILFLDYLIYFNTVKVKMYPRDVVAWIISKKDEHLIGKLPTLSYSHTKLPVYFIISEQGHEASFALTAAVWGTRCPVSCLTQQEMVELTGESVKAKASELKMFCSMERPSNYPVVCLLSADFFRWQNLQ